MWINKNVYLYEKKVAADRIAELERQVRCLEVLEVEESQPYRGVRPSDAYTEPSPAAAIQDQRILQKRLESEIAGQRQADHLNPFLTQNERSCAGFKQSTGLGSGYSSTFGSVFGG